MEWRNPRDVLPRIESVDSVTDIEVSENGNPYEYARRNSRTVRFKKTTTLRTVDVWALIQVNREGKQILNGYYEQRLTHGKYSGQDGFVVKSNFMSRTGIAFAASRVIRWSYDDPEAEEKKGVYVDFVDITSSPIRADYSVDYFDDLLRREMERYEREREAIMRDWGSSYHDLLECKWQHEIRMNTLRNGMLITDAELQERLQRLREEEERRQDGVKKAFRESLNRDLEKLRGIKSNYDESKTNNAYSKFMGSLMGEAAKAGKKTIADYVIEQLKRESPYYKMRGK